MDGSQFTAPDARITAVISRRPNRLRHLLFGVVALLALAGIGLTGRYYWTTARFQISTDDAYVQADSVLISPKVSGYIVSVPVTDNQPVHQGQVLARIDDRDYRAALAQAKAAVMAASASVDNLQQSIAQQQLTIAQARAAVAADAAAVTFSTQQNRRYADLSKTGAVTIQDAQQWAAATEEKQAVQQRDEAAVGAAVKQIDVLNTNLAKARAELQQQQALEQQAELNLSYTTITAPIDGTIGVRSLRVGQYVQAGTQLMAVVPLQAVYITANYKETQLTNVHAGQPVTIQVDTFPDVRVQGWVDSIAPASGQEFALLPPDNATGNFTKIVQRIPVKIRIDPHDPLLGQLRPGMSVEPTIDTRPAS